MGTPDYLPCLLRYLYAGQEATVRTGHGTTDWFQIGKGVQQDYILSPCLFNLYVEYIMRNARLDEAQAGIKVAGRNINNLSYTDDTTLMEGNEEEIKSLSIKMKEKSETVSLRHKLESRLPGKEKKESEVTQSCPNLYNPMDCNLPGFSVHGNFQARGLEWVAISASRGSARPRD